MKLFLLSLLVLLAGAFVSVSATCQDDFEACKTAYVHGLPNTSGKPGALCLLANTYITCLRKLTNTQTRPDCQAMASHMSETRRKTEEMLNHNSTDCTLCTSKVDACRGTFDASASQAGQDITAVCKDGQTFIQCLQVVDMKPECQAEKSRLEESRRKAEEKLHEAGCDASHACLTGIQGCETQEAASKDSATTHALQCQVAGTFYNCLISQHCTGEYEKFLKTAVDAVVLEAKDANCTFANSINSADEITPSRAAAMLLTVVVAAILS